MDYRRWSLSDGIENECEGNMAIYDHNATIIDKLVYDGFATCDRFQGEHNARDYIINRSFSDLIHRAINLFQV